MSNLVQRDLKFRVVKEQFEDGSFGEPYVEVEVGKGEAYLRGMDANRLIEDILDSIRSLESEENK